MTSFDINIFPVDKQGIQCRFKVQPQRLCIEENQPQRCRENYEAVLVTMHVGHEVKAYMTYRITVDHTAYPVEQEFYENCREEGETAFCYGMVAGI